MLELKVKEEVVVIFWFFCGLTLALLAAEVLGVVIGAAVLGLSAEVSFFFGLLVQAIYWRIGWWIMG